jgi:hypothetical protein
MRFRSFSIPVILAVAAMLATAVAPAQTSRPLRFGTPAASRPADPDRARRVEAIMAGLEWLRRHQSPDGNWGAATFSINCDPDRAKCGGRGDPVNDAGVTGLALLAFLGAGYDSAGPSAYLDTVRSGLKFLKNIQDAQGCFGPTVATRFIYSHAIATQAMCEAYGQTKQLPWRKSAEWAVGFIAKAQNPYKAWRYGVQPKENDASVTGHVLLALASAKDAGIPVSDASIRCGLAFLDSLTDEDTGRTGYIKKGEEPVRLAELNAKFPPSESESLTALAICARYACGAADSPWNARGIALLAKKPPVWSEDRGSIDMIYWCYGSLAMAHAGGPAPRRRWESALLTAALADQVRTGCAEGSWDPKDPWGADGGRVYSTAMMVRALEAALWFPPKREPPADFDNWAAESRPDSKPESRK